MFFDMEIIEDNGIEGQKIGIKHADFEAMEFLNPLFGKTIRIGVSNKVTVDSITTVERRVWELSVVKEEEGYIINVK